jgi:hypothetical protein
MLSLFSFLMALSNYVGRFSLASAGISAQLGYRFVLDKMIPEVSYFTIADSLYLVLLVMSFLVFASQLFIGRYCSLYIDKDPDPVKVAERLRVVEIINGVCFYVIQVIVMVASTLIIIKT